MGWMCVCSGAECAGPCGRVMCLAERFVCSAGGLCCASSGLQNNPRRLQETGANVISHLSKKTKTFSVGFLKPFRCALLSYTAVEQGSAQTVILFRYYVHVITIILIVGLGPTVRPRRNGVAGSPFEEAVFVFHKVVSVS